MDDSRKVRLIENKPVGVGAAIGFLCWQNAMGMYINYVLSWNETRRCFNLKKKDKFFIPYVREMRAYA